jgi:hypothetical protein
VQTSIHDAHRIVARHSHRRIRPIQLKQVSSLRDREGHRLRPRSCISEGWRG